MSAPGPYMVPAPNHEWVERLRRHLSAIQRLTNGLRKHLSVMSNKGVDDICGAIDELFGREISEQLKQLENPLPAFRATTKPRPEMLIQATEDRDAVQKQLDTLDAFVSEVPKAQGDFLEAQLAPALKAKLADAERWIQTIQHAMENPEPERWTMKRQDEEFFRVLERPPVVVYAVARLNPPGHEGQTEIAENPDGSLKIYLSEDFAKTVAASESGEGWKAMMLILQATAPEPSISANPTPEATALPQAPTTSEAPYST